MVSHYFMLGSSERTATPENQRYPLDYDEEYTPMNSVMYRKQSASDEYIDIDETADAERIPEISESGMFISLGVVCVKIILLQQHLTLIRHFKSVSM